jgi:hypothetical protein
MRHEGDVKSAQFSPDGTRIVTVSWDKTARVWSSPGFTTSWARVPDWVLDYAQAVAGFGFDAQGRLQRISGGQRFETLRQARPGDDVWSNLARWAAVPVPERTITPGSRFTLRQIAERERDFEPPSRASLESALRYDPSLPLAHVLLAEAIGNENAASPTEGAEVSDKRAEFLRTYGLKRIPENDAVLWCRAAESLLRQNDPEKSRDAVEKALAAAPGMARALALQKTLDELPTKQP